MTWQEQDLYGSARLGIAKPEREMTGFFWQSGSYTLVAGAKSYELSNHLGNVLAVISDRGELQSAQDYFPFGMAMPGRSTGAYRYGFNGKETDPETGLNDFGARLYDNRLGRWLAVDPLEKKYPALTPYNFVANNPIQFIDPNGKEIVVPKIEDREAVLKMIHSRSQGTFAFDDKGKLYLVKDDNKSGYSNFYKTSLVEAIKDKKSTITITLGEITIPKYAKRNPGKKDSYNGEGGKTYSSEDQKKQGVFIESENVSVTGLKDTKGESLRDDAADILVHELIGHAIPRTKGGAYKGNAINNENRVRAELKGREDLPGQNQQREMKKGTLQEAHVQ